MYRIERSNNSNAEDAAPGRLFVTLLDRDKQVKVENYGTQPRQRQR